MIEIYEHACAPACAPFVLKHQVSCIIIFSAAPTIGTLKRDHEPRVVLRKVEEYHTIHSAIQIRGYLKNFGLVWFGSQKNNR